MNLKPFAMAVALLASTHVFADVSEELSYTFKLEEGGRFSLENVNGNVTVTGVSGNVVEIVAVKKASNQEALDNIRILIDETPASIRVETEYAKKDQGGWFSRHKGDSGSVTYTVKVPSGANLEDVESVNGDLRISGVHGVIKASTVNGDIEAGDLSSGTDLETVNGSVNAHFVALKGAQRAKCESVNGRLTVHLPQDADTKVSAETINGGIDGSDFGLSTSRGFIGRDLEGEIGSGSARLALSTVNGAIKIHRD